MTSLDLLESFDGTTAKIALVATYQFDPLFFERRVLRKRGFNGAERILVLMDAGRYQELLNEGLPVSGFNRRYLVVPIDRHPFVFHPKLYLLIGERRVTGIVGSSNCTNAGIAFNVELCSTFSAEWSGDDQIGLLHATADFYGAAQLRRGRAKLQDDLAKRILCASRGASSLARGRGRAERPLVELLHSHREPLWPHVKRRLKSRNGPEDHRLRAILRSGLGLPQNAQDDMARRQIVRLCATEIRDTRR